MSSGRIISTLGHVDARVVRSLTRCLLRPTPLRLASHTASSSAHQDTHKSPLDEVLEVDRSKFPWYARWDHPSGYAFFFVVFLQVALVLWFGRERTMAISAGRHIPFAQGANVSGPGVEVSRQLKAVMTNQNAKGQVIVTGAPAGRGDVVRAAASDARARYLTVTMPPALIRTKSSESADPLWLPKAFLVAAGYNPDRPSRTLYCDSFLHRALEGATNNGVRPVLHVKVPADAAVEPYEAAVAFAAKMSRIATVVVDVPPGVADLEAPGVEDILRSTPFTVVRA